MVIAHYDGFTRPSSIPLNKIDIWIQIHDPPDGFFSYIKSSSTTMGEFIYAESMSHDLEGNFFRVCVKIGVENPLENAISLVIKKKREIFYVKYDRLPDWCVVCGKLGHMFKEGGNGIPPPQMISGLQGPPRFMVLGGLTEDRAKKED